MRNRRLACAPATVSVVCMWAHGEQASEVPTAGAQQHPSSQACPLSPSPMSPLPPDVALGLWMLATEVNHFPGTPAVTVSPVRNCTHGVADGPVLALVQVPDAHTTSLTPPPCPPAPPLPAQTPASARCPLPAATSRAAPPPWPCTRTRSAACPWSSWPRSPPTPTATRSPSGPCRTLPYPIPPWRSGRGRCACSSLATCTVDVA